jgi:hypothetical protein
MRLCAVSVDLDEIPCYSAIHGLPALPARAGEAVYRAAVPRFEQLFDALGLRATFFAIGRDLDQPHARAALRRLHDRGHEIGNHSLDHFYDLTRRTRAEMQTQVVDGARAIELAVGRAPRGFRAPGYTVNDTLFEVLGEAGVSYDSSVFPCPGYDLAKAAVLGSYRLRGRPSRSIFGHPRVLSAPADPYRVGVPYSRRGRGLLELPIGVTRDMSGRLPYIGTQLILGGAAGARTLTRLIEGRPLVNLELHGIDAADAERDGLQALRPHQPDLRRSAYEKLDILQSSIEQLRKAGYEFVTLDEAAQRMVELAVLSGPAS